MNNKAKIITILLLFGLATILFMIGLGSNFLASDQGDGIVHEVSYFENCVNNAEEDTITCTFLSTSIIGTIVENCTVLRDAIDYGRAEHAVTVMSSGVVVLVNIVRYILEGRDCMRDTNERIEYDDFGNPIETIIKGVDGGGDGDGDKTKKEENKKDSDGGGGCAVDDEEEYEEFEELEEDEEVEVDDDGNENGNAARSDAVEAIADDAKKKSFAIIDVENCDDCGAASANSKSPEQNEHEHANDESIHKKKTKIIKKTILKPIVKKTPNGATSVTDGSFSPPQNMNVSLQFGNRSQSVNPFASFNGSNVNFNHNNRAKMGQSMMNASRKSAVVVISSSSDDTSDDDDDDDDDDTTSTSTPSSQNDKKMNDPAASFQRPSDRNSPTSVSSLQDHDQNNTLISKSSPTPKAAVEGESENDIHQQPHHQDIFLEIPPETHHQQEQEQQAEEIAEATYRRKWRPRTKAFYTMYLISVFLVLFFACTGWTISFGLLYATFCDVVLAESAGNTVGPSPIAMMIGTALWALGCVSELYFFTFPHWNDVCVFCRDSDEVAVEKVLKADAEDKGIFDNEERIKELDAERGGDSDDTSDEDKMAAKEAKVQRRRHEDMLEVFRLEMEEGDDRKQVAEDEEDRFEQIGFSFDVELVRVKAMIIHLETRRTGSQTSPRRSASPRRHNNNIDENGNIATTSAVNQQQRAAPSPVIVNTNNNNQDQELDVIVPAPEKLEVENQNSDNKNSNDHEKHENIHSIKQDDDEEEEEDEIHNEDDEAAYAEYVELVRQITEKERQANRSKRREQREERAKLRRQKIENGEPIDDDDDDDEAFFEDDDNKKDHDNQHDDLLSDDATIEESKVNDPLEWEEFQKFLQLSTTARNDENDEENSISNNQQGESAGAQQQQNVIPKLALKKIAGFLQNENNNNNNSSRGQLSGRVGRNRPSAAISSLSSTDREDDETKLAVIEYFQKQRHRRLIAVMHLEHDETEQRRDIEAIESESREIAIFLSNENQKTQNPAGPSLSTLMMDERSERRQRILRRRIKRDENTNNNNGNDDDDDDGDDEQNRKNNNNIRHEIFDSSLEDEDTPSVGTPDASDDLISELLNSLSPSTAPVAETSKEKDQKEYRDPNDLNKNQKMKIENTNNKNTKNEPFAAAAAAKSSANNNNNLRAAVAGNNKNVKANNTAGKTSSNANKNNVLADDKMAADEKKKPTVPKQEAASSSNSKNITKSNLPSKTNQKPSGKK